MATNVPGTWPRTWPEHERQMVQWPRCNVASELNRLVGHVPATLNMATTWLQTWPHCDQRGRKRDQQHCCGQLTNVAHRPRSWPATWPERLATLRATFEVFSTFSFFIDFFAFQCRYQSQTLFAKVRTLKTQKPFENYIFHQLFSKRKTPKWELENMLRASNWLNVSSSELPVYNCTQVLIAEMERADP